MPGDSTNVGPVAQPMGDSNQAVQFKPGDEPALASIDRMDMSAPIEPVIPNMPAGEVPHKPKPVPVSVMPFVPPLSDNVSPFRVPEPRVPATEYVHLPVEPIAMPPASVKKPEPVIPAPLPPQPVPQPQAPSKPAAPPAKPPQANQAIGPIIRKRPVAPPPAPKPQPPVTAPAKPTSIPVTTAAPQPSVSAPQPVAVKVAEPAPPPQPAAVTAPPPPPPMPEPVVPPPAPVSLPVEPVEIPLPPEIPEVAAQQAVPAEKLTPGKPMMIYSHNTRAVWQARRSSRVLNVVMLIVILVVFGGAFVYWLSIGSPTSVEDLPFISSQK